MSFFKRLFGGESAQTSEPPITATGIAPVVVSDQNFAEVVLNATQPVVVDFWAVWCGPCNYIRPSVEKLAAAFDGQAVVAKLNVDESSRTPAAYSIMGIPTLIYFKNGKEVDRVTGVQPYEQLARRLQALV